MLLLADLEKPPASTGDNPDDGILPKKSKSSLRLHKIQTDVAGYSIKGHLPKSKSIAGIAATSRRSSSNHGQGSDWLLSTASVLAINTAESKGQSWLATRSSSTSLVGTPYLERDDFMSRPFTKTHDDDIDLLSSPQASQPGTRRNSLLASAGMKLNSRGGSRANSRITSRVGSRINLTADLARKIPSEVERRADYFASMGVDFADQAMLDAEDDSGSELDEFEEGELKKLVWGRVGGWVDWAVGWMDWRDGLEGVDEEEDDISSSQEKSQIQEGLKQRLKKKATIKLDGVQVDVSSNVSLMGYADPIPIPPETAGVIGDAKWLIGVASKLIV